MRIGSLFALVVAVVAIAIAVSTSAAVAGPGPVYPRSPTLIAQHVKGHPMRLAQIGLLTSYRWAQPGCAPVFTPHAQPWS